MAHHSHAFQFDAVGKAGEVLHWREVAKPVLQNDNEVLVRVKAAPVHPSDLMFVGGIYGNTPKFPGAPVGYEAAGIVEEVGKGVKDLKVGQKVHVGPVLGTWSEYVVAPFYLVIPVPDVLSFEEASQLTTNPLTALALFEELGVKPGDFLLQTAASSALGRILIQFAKLRGIKTINLVRKDELIKELKELGADYVFNYTSGDWVAHVKEVVGDNLKYAVDSVAGELGAEILKVLGPGGTVLIYGVNSKTNYNLDVGALIFKGLTVRGFWVTQWGPSHLDKLPALYGEIIGHLASKKAKFAHRTFHAKTDLAQAVAYALSPGKTEKAVLLF